MHMKVQPLYPIILCASRLAQVACSSEGHEGNALARACIIHCSLIVEALANSLLFSMKFEANFSNDLEKLNTFAKLQMFSLMTKGKDNIFTKGSKAGQVMSELIKIRNDYVHPKVFTEKDIDYSDDSYYVSVRKDLSFLKISKNPEIWSPPDAIQVLDKALEAVDIYLMDEIQICNRQVERIMLHHIIEGKDNTILVTVEEKPWRMKLPDGVRMPRFMHRLEFHDSFCSH
jgi:hypothetical protein